MSRNYRSTASLFVLLSLCATNLVAQTEQETLTRQLEVVRAYEPTVGVAEKLPAKPNLIDTAMLRPELSYELTPRPLMTAFGVAPIQPASIHIGQSNYNTPLYIKAGLGYPFQSVLDVYANSTGMEQGRVGAYLNHYGSWSKINNEMGIDAPASLTQNSVGVVGERWIGRYTLSGEVGYDYDLVSDYGYQQSPYFSTINEELMSADSLRAQFSTIRARVNFGDNFEDLSYFNFRIGAEGAYFNGRNSNAYTDFGVRLDLGKRLGNQHELLLGVAYGAVGAVSDAPAYQNSIFTLSPRYRLQTGKFDMLLGVDYTYSSLNEEGRAHLYPQVEMRMDLTNGYFVPYFELKGGLKSNDPRTLTALNPHWSGETMAPNTSEYNARVGIQGSFASSFSYKLYAGYSHINDLVMMSTLYSAQSAGNYFTPISDSLNMWVFGGDIEGRFSGDMTFNASVLYRGFSGGAMEYLSGIPHLTANLGLRYCIQDQVILTLDGTLLSNRHFAIEQQYSTSLSEYSYEQIGTTFDLGFGVEYRLDNQIGLFLQGTNLTNTKLYPYYNYRGLGIGALAGVKIDF